MANRFSYGERQRYWVENDFRERHWGRSNERKESGGEDRDKEVKRKQMSLVVASGSTSMWSLLKMDSISVE